MTVSKKIVLSADGATATVANAEIMDTVTTLFSTNEAVTGLLGLAQKVGLVLAGMAAQSYRKTGSLNILA